MRGVFWGFAALALTASSSALGAPAPPTTVSVEADVFVWGLGSDRLDASGRAVLSYHGFSLCADNIIADRRTGKVEAAGNLAFLQGERRLTGERLTYDMREEAGALENAQMYERGVIIRGERIEFSPHAVVAHGAHFTTCGRPEPHYGFAARRISLTAAESEQGRTSEAGVLTLDGGRLDYHGRRLVALPRLSLNVGGLESEGISPFPVVGFSKEDGPYASLSYSLGGPHTKTVLDLGYRYTTFRGVRGDIRLHHRVGPVELVTNFVRREDNADRELLPDELETNLDDVLVNRSPEYGVRLPGLPLGRALNLRAEWLRGRYREWDPETDARISDRRESANALVSTVPYRVARGVRLSHAVGWRRSRYASGESMTVELYRNSVSFDLGRRRELSLSHVVRDESGATPFRFDRVGAARALLADLRWRLNPTWRFRVTNSIDLAEGVNDDVELSLTRTIHCLDYTLGWRSARSKFFFGVGLAPTAP